VVETPDQCSLSGPTSKRRVSRRPQDAFSLLTRVVLTKVAHKLKAPDVPRQLAFTPAAKHPQLRLE